MKHLNLLIFIVLLSSGCSTKKKFTERKSIETERVQEKAVQEVKLHTAVIDSTAEVTSEVLKIRKGKSIHIESASDSVPVTVKSKTDGNVQTWEISGAKTVKIGQEETFENKRDSSSVKKSSESIKTDLKNESESTEESSEESGRTTNVDAQRFGFWLVIGVPVLIVVFFLFLYLRRRRRSPIV